MMNSRWDFPTLFVLSLDWYRNVIFTFHLPTFFYFFLLRMTACLISANIFLQCFYKFLLTFTIKMIGKKLFLLLTIVLILTLECRVILYFGSGWSWPRIWYITVIRASLDLVDKNWLIPSYQIASWLIRIDTIVPNFIRRKR